MSDNYNKKVYIYNKESKEQEAILLVNLGSPKSAKKQDVKKYLSEFLIDKNVIGLPYPLRYILVNGIIVPFRSSYSSSLYEKIWDYENHTFPLIKESIDLTTEVAKQTNKTVAIAMRYATPSIKETLKHLQKLNKIKKIKVLPLYPHYTLSTFKTAWDKVREDIKDIGWKDVSIECMSPFYNNPTYRDILADSIRPYLNKPFDKLIVSFHGIPLSHLSKHCRQDNGNTNFCENHSKSKCEDKDNCYRNHVEKSFKYLIKDLGIDKNKTELVYQSRLGKLEWMKPYIWERVDKWVSEGAKNILVVCPGFIADCLETISEIDMEYREKFLNSGGESFTYIPCISRHKDMAKMIVNYMH